MGTKTCYVMLLIFCTLHAISSTGKDEAKENDQPAETEKPDEQTMYELPKEVIVVGGGIAGIAAARTITKDRSNFTVKVFEAQKDRYGGRIFTDKMIRNRKARGIEVDLGAMFLNVLAKNNPLLELVEKFELETTSLDNPQFIIPWEKKTFSGDELTSLKKETQQILKRALHESQSVKSDISVKDAVDNVLKEMDYRTEVEELMKTLSSYALGDYSIKNYVPEQRDAGFQMVLLDGMGELVDRLVGGSSDEPPLHIYLNKAVRQIKVDEEKGKVIVRTTDGLQTYADVVVVAVSSSVIANQNILFEPPLPKEYQQACREIPLSAGNKVIIEFEHVFWPKDFGLFIRAVKTDEERGHFQAWFNIHRMINKPVLSGHLSGEPAVRFENMTDEEAEKSALAALVDMFGEETVQKGGKIVGLQRSNWMSDPLFSGTGTYPKVGADQSLWDVLSEPLCPYIYFAGEHTNSEARGPVHGAYNSGVRVGNQILSHLCDVRMEEERRRKELERKRKEEEQSKNKTSAHNVSYDEKEEL